MEMICPKVKLCILKTEENIHCRIHDFTPQCNHPCRVGYEDIVKTPCIEYKPEPPGQLYILPPEEKIKGILRQEVVIDEETITERSDTWKSHGGCMHEDYIDTLTEQIYASAKPVDIKEGQLYICRNGNLEPADIEALAEYLEKEREYLWGVSEVKQAITKYMEDPHADRK